MKRRFVLFAVPGLLILAGCGAEPFRSTAEACSAYSAALSGYPFGTVSRGNTPKGLSQWASQVRVVAEETAEVSNRTDDALLSQLMGKAVDAMFEAVETAEAAADDPSSMEASTAASQAFVDGELAIRDVTTFCTSAS